MSSSMTEIYPLVSVVAALGAAALSLFLFVASASSNFRRLAAAGLACIAVEQVSFGLSFWTGAVSQSLQWLAVGMVASSLLPGVWLFCTTSFTVETSGGAVGKWKWALALVLLAPAGLFLLSGNHFYVGTALRDPQTGTWIRVLSWPGYFFYLIFILVATFILVQLEQALRSSKGHRRWQVKYFVLGIGGIFAVRIYTCSQSVLFSVLDSRIELVNSVATLIFGAFILIGVWRMGSDVPQLHLSATAVHRSIALLLVGSYLILVALMVKGTHALQNKWSTPLGDFLLFLALGILAGLLLSENVRLFFRRMVSRHFKRSYYDYRNLWMDFTRRTKTVFDVAELCQTVAGMIAGIFQVSKVSLWVVREGGERLSPGGSCVFSLENMAASPLVSGKCREVLEALFDRPAEEPLSRSSVDLVEVVERVDPDIFGDSEVRYVVPLRAGGEVVGMMTLSDRVRHLPLSLEDFELLETLAEQTAGALLNVKVTRELRRKSELEALQNVSAFLMHDLKNLVSSLSLTLQNLPVHFDNPEFRADSIRVIRSGVDRINLLCSRLSQVRQEIDIKQKPTNLSRLVKISLDELNGSFSSSIQTILGDVPEVSLDPDQIKKVVVNLLRNSDDATGADGQIQVQTGRTPEGGVVLSVQDNGHGMTREFIAQSLFRPFFSTKEQGMGIGLFQCKKIIDAHGGRIEVDSQPGLGTCFRIFLPGSGSGASD